MGALTNWTGGPEVPKGRRIAIGVLASMLMLVFLMTGVTKLVAAPMAVEDFRRWELPDWFRPIVGTIEVLAAILLFMPRTRFWGAGVLVCTMLGALATHLRIAEYAALPPPGVLLVLAATLAWLTRDRAVGLPSGIAGSS